VSTFASNIHRLQQIINSSQKYGRKVAFSGRSMERISEIARNIGYLTIPEGTLIDLKDIKLYNNEQITIVTTGSQGEPMAALTRISAGTHRSIFIEKDDTVIISATPIPGNKKPVSKVINELSRRGANVIYKSIQEIHVSGHACQEELKLIHCVLKPKFFMPVHGETSHLLQHAKIAEELGMSKSNIFIIENGDVLNLTRQSARVTGKVHTGKILIDGSGLGDVGSIVLRDRKYLSQDGIITIVVVIDRETQSIMSGPDVVTRGFIYVRESEQLVREIRNLASDSIEKCMANEIYQWSQVKRNIRNDVSFFIYGRTKRRPMIVPVIMEV
ncbi:MAG: ribonuclease J, partial [Clostridium sp.]